MRRIMEASGQKTPDARPVLEVNPKHALLKRIESLSDDDELTDLSRLLLEQATLVNGGRLSEPAEFVRRLNRLLMATVADSNAETMPGNGS